MKKKFFLDIIIGIVVAVASIITIFAVVDKEDAPVHCLTLFEDFQIYRHDSRSCEIKNESVSDSHGKEVIENGWIYKFSYDADNKFIAVRKLTADNDPSADEEVVYYRYAQGTKYAVYRDEVKLYNCNTKEFKNFENESELARYCEANNINLCEWYYPTGDGFSQEELASLSDDFTVKKYPYGYSSVLFNGRETAYGYIDDIKTTNEQISFRLRRPKPEFSPDYVTANDGLSALSEKRVGRYRESLLSHIDIYYDKIVCIDTATGNITEK